MRTHDSRPDLPPATLATVSRTSWVRGVFGFGDRGYTLCHIVQYCKEVSVFAVEKGYMVLQKWKRGDNQSTNEPMKKYATSISEQPLPLCDRKPPGGSQDSPARGQRFYADEEIVVVPMDTVKEGNRRSKSGGRKLYFDRPGKYPAWRLFAVWRSSKLIWIVVGRNLMANSLILELVRSCEIDFFNRFFRFCNSSSEVSKNFSIVIWYGNIFKSKSSYSSTVVVVSMFGLANLENPETQRFQRSWTRSWIRSFFDVRVANSSKLEVALLHSSSDFWCGNCQLFAKSEFELDRMSIRQLLIVWVWTRSIFDTAATLQVFGVRVCTCTWVEFCVFSERARDRTRAAVEFSSQHSGPLRICLRALGR